MRKAMKVRDLLTHESKWTQYSLARNRVSEGCLVNSPGAAKYSLLGAVYATYGDKTPKARRAITKLVVAAGLPVDVPVQRLATWNDDAERTFEEVRKVIEKADV
jgi:hypothetical protein